MLSPTAIILILASVMVAPEPPRPRANPAPANHADQSAAPAAEPRAPGLFDDRILTIAREYRSYTRVSDRVYWSPTRCDAPPPAGVQRSASGDEATHGRKLYLLYAKDVSSYQQMSADKGARTEQPGDEARDWTNPVGQVVVKEAFKPVAVEPGQPTPPTDSVGLRRWVHEDGKTFAAGEPSGLFIMFKLDPQTKDTDQGWVYAVTSPDATKVLDAGRIASCMGCHEQTTRDRLYGAKSQWPLDPKTHEPKPPVKPRSPSAPLTTGNDHAQPPVADSPPR